MLSLIRWQEHFCGFKENVLDELLHFVGKAKSTELIFTVLQCYIFIIKLYLDVHL